jgi:hypothetical protein
MPPDSPTTLARVKYWYNRCKPDVPVPADDPDHWYVDFDGQGLRGERCTGTAASTINLAQHPICQLFTGFQGSGKTSELLRLIGALEREEHFVVYADALRSVDTRNEIAYPDVLVALGLATNSSQRRSTLRWMRRCSSGSVGTCRSSYSSAAIGSICSTPATQSAPRIVAVQVRSSTSGRPDRTNRKGSSSTRSGSSLAAIQSTSWSCGP